MGSTHNRRVVTQHAHENRFPVEYNNAKVGIL